MNLPAGFVRRSPLLLSVLLVLLLASIAINIRLLQRLKSFYAREMRIRLQPMGGHNIVRQGQPDGKRVLFLGDSRMAEWPPLPTDKYLTINAGAYGDTTSQTRLRTESLLSNEKPSVVILQAGINDLKAIGVLPLEAKQIQQNCLRNIIEIVELCRRTKTPVVLTLILPAGQIEWLRRPVWSNETVQSIRAINASLSKIFSSDSGVVVLDLEKIINLQSTNPRGSTAYRDALHLKAATYEQLQPELLDAIEKALTSTPSPVNSNIPSDQ